MDKGPNKLYFPVNLLLAAVAVFTFTLTIYSCSRFFAYLPTSDVWVHVDFLVQAAQGHLDVQALFEKHNNAHLIVLPKLVYFFDMWLTRGSGILVVCVSLFALLATAGIFIAVIHNTSALDRQEKIFLSLLSSIFLLSTCQVESLLNPANLQWSLLNFTATVTAWFAWKFSQDYSLKHAVGICAGVVLVSLTSASALLMVVPLLVMMAVFRFGKLIVWRTGIIAAGIVFSVYVGGELIRSLLFPDQLPLLFFLVEHLSGVGVSEANHAGISRFFADSLEGHSLLAASWLKFNVDFLAPPVERLHSMALTVFVGGILLYGLMALARSAQKAVDHVGVFFGLLLLFVLFTAAATGLVRSYSPTAFTFRFVNLGLLFVAALFPLIYLQFKEKQLFFVPGFFIYLALLSFVNVTEASAFGYGRNHVRLNQVAYSLDIRDSFVVSALPGTIWEKIDFDYVQVNKHKLQEQGAGIYSDEAYKNVGKPISELTTLAPVTCTNKIIKMRRLLPDQEAYRLLGESHVQDNKNPGGNLEKVYFTDSAGIIRGYAISVAPSRKIWENWLQDEQWAGFVNLDSSADKNLIFIYAYSNKAICVAESVKLPAYIKPNYK